MLANLLTFDSTMRSGHNLGGCRLNLSMFLLTISVGRFWGVQSVLEFNAIKKNLRIMSDIERGFGPFYSVWLLACFCSLHLATPVS